MTHPILISVVDPDPSGVARIRAIARDLGVPCKSFRAAEKFLDSNHGQYTGCLVTEIRLPGMDGLALQKRLLTPTQPLHARKRQINAELRLPFGTLAAPRSRRSADPAPQMVFVTAHANTRRTVQAMQSGAVTVLDKASAKKEIKDAIQLALTRDKTLRRTYARRSIVRKRLALLTDKERQVLDLMLQGKTNQWIARRLRVSLRTIESRRHQVFKKMKTDSIAQLVKSVVILEAERT